MVYYRSMRGLRAAISRKMTIWSFRDDSPLSGSIEIIHRRTDANMQLLPILHRVHDYTMKTVCYHEGLNLTTITVKQLSELAGPIPTEFLTNK